jgi:hypothetical protein
MAKNFGPSAFFASDKSIFDGLMQKKIPKSKLLDFLCRKGIVLSPDISRRELALYVSRTFVDYYTCQQISSFLESEQRREKTTNSFVEVEINKSEIITACQSLQENIDNGETCVVSHYGDMTKLTVTYEDVDFSKTELRQRSTKTCEIEITHTDEGFSVRQPANDKASHITAEIIEKISESKGEKIKPEVISLTRFREPECRSFFFERLIHSVEGHQLVDVIAVSINHKLSDGLADDDDDEPSELSDEELDRIVTGYITKAVLNGTGVLESSEFSQLHREGFFISKIVWHVIDRDLTNSKKIELEALFKEPDSCTEFAYLCRGYYEKRDENFNITRKSFEKGEDKPMMLLLEKAAKAAYQEVIEKYGGS